MYTKSGTKNDYISHPKPFTFKLGKPSLLKCYEAFFLYEEIKSDEQNLNYNFLYIFLVLQTQDF